MDHGIDELPYLRTERRGQLSDEKIIEIRDIPRDFPLRESQQIVRTAVIEKHEIVNQKELKVIAVLEQPIYYLDFETYSPAIPRFAGTRPYDAIPFLFSVHLERMRSRPGHKQYLHEGKDDPRPQLAKRLIRALGRKGTICAYGSYESRVLRELIVAVPNLANELREITNRIVDLHKLSPHAYYHPDFRGSYSL